MFNDMISGPWLTASDMAAPDTAYLLMKGRGFKGKQQEECLLVDCNLILVQILPI